MCTKITAISYTPIKLCYKQIPSLKNVVEIEDQNAGEDPGVDAVANVGGVVVRLAPSDDDVLLGR